VKTKKDMGVCMGFGNIGSALRSLKETTKAGILAVVSEVSKEAKNALLRTAPPPSAEDDDSPVHPMSSLVSDEPLPPTPSKSFSTTVFNKEEVMPKVQTLIGGNFTQAEQLSNDEYIRIRMKANIPSEQELLLAVITASLLRERPGILTVQKSEGNTFLPVAIMAELLAACQTQSVGSPITTAIISKGPWEAGAIRSQILSLHRNTALPYFRVEHDRHNEIAFENGSRILILPCVKAETALRGVALHRLVIDDGDEMPSFGELIGLRCTIVAGGLIVVTLDGRKAVGQPLHNFISQSTFMIDLNKPNASVSIPVVATDDLTNQKDFTKFCVEERPEAFKEALDAVNAKVNVVPDQQQEAINMSSHRRSLVQKALEARVKEMEVKLLSEKAKRHGIETSEDLDKTIFVISSEQELHRGSEREIVQQLIEAKEKNGTSSVLDITPSLQVWASIVAKSAGGKMVVWSPDSIMSKVGMNIDRSTNAVTFNERVYIEVDNNRVTHVEDITDFLPGLTTVENSEVKSINVSDVLNPHQTTYTEPVDEMTEKLDVLTFDDLEPLINTARKFALPLGKPPGLEPETSYKARLAAALQDAAALNNPITNKTGESYSDFIRRTAVTEDEVRMSVPEDAESAEKRATLLKAFEDNKDKEKP